jgi:hypothetical protein
MMVTKVMEQYLFATLAKTTIVSTTFDLWMSQGGFDMFVIIVNYINKKRETCHITIEFFKVHETSWATMAMQLRDLFTTWYKLLDKVITYVKDEGVNLTPSLWP